MRKLLALGTVLHDRPVFLPFFEPPGHKGVQNASSPAHRPGRSFSSAVRREV
jgi:hypothetical protein